MQGVNRNQRISENAQLRSFLFGFRKADGIPVDDNRTNLGDPNISSFNRRVLAWTCSERLSENDIFSDIFAYPRLDYDDLNGHNATGAAQQFCLVGGGSHYDPSRDRDLGNARWDGICGKPQKRQLTTNSGRSGADRL